MLGLGNSLIYSNKGRNKVLNYTSDFTSDNDSWVKNPTTTPWTLHTGTPTVTANQTIDGTSGWLKIVYGSTQTSLATGIMERDLFTSGGFVNGDIVSASMKVYLYHDGSTDHWDGTDPVQVRFKTKGVNIAIQGDVSLNTTTTIGFENKTTSILAVKDIMRTYISVLTK